MSSIKEMTHKGIQYENDEDAPGGPSTSGKNIPGFEHRYGNDLDRLWSLKPEIQDKNGCTPDLNATTNNCKVMIHTYIV
ncbi:MAG: hypothetical protein LBP35_02280 [Candidatus Ancillula trichonymphae]|nr:hypothetical protein [Candidatus Ancillula trichonymphae]